ncbi:EscU/YscU/HrcU family type III secretion system export apparatus switch protein [Bacillus sp. RO3]|nr:EscU/YscU/HrcU family type III secretion system export apparatus switch protein [Bacillus sp. RO3]
MNVQFSKPKGFGEILDHTFRLSKNRFKDFFLIFLILLGPVYVLQALIELAAGVSFFRTFGTGETWLERVISSFSGEFSVEDGSEMNIAAELGTGLVGLISMILAPIAQAAILFALLHMRKNEEFTVKLVIKEAFSRFWPIIGSSLLFGLIVFGIVFVPIFIFGMLGIFGAAFLEPGIGVIVAGIVLILAFAVAVAYLLIRWSFYFGAAAVENNAPGLGRSWRLTKKRGWIILGLFIVLGLIIGIISAAFEFTFGLMLGNSVLYGMIVNVVTLFTSMLFAVAFGVIFFDLKTRHDAEDLNEMIDDYNTIQ